MDSGCSKASDNSGSEPEMLIWMVNEITVKKMEVTPLLWSLYLDYDEAMKVYEDEKKQI